MTDGQDMRYIGILLRNKLQSFNILLRGIGSIPWHWYIVTLGTTDLLWFHKNLNNQEL